MSLLELIRSVHGDLGNESQWVKDCKRSILERLYDESVSGHIPTLKEPYIKMFDAMEIIEEEFGE